MGPEMDIVAKLDDLGKPAWIALMVLGFIVFWPIGLGILFYLIWSGRMRSWKHCGPGRWYHERAEGWRGPRRWRGGREAESSGNSAFDEYRTETLRRLEDEEREFHDFLDQLRKAKDKAEFDEFLAQRRRRPPEPEVGSEPPSPQPA